MDTNRSNPRILTLLAWALAVAPTAATAESDIGLHRLKPGDDLTIKVDTRNRRHRAARTTAGHSCHKVAGWAGAPYSADGSYTLHPSLEKAVRDLHLPMTRFYALGDEKFSLAQAIDKAADFCDRTGIPQNRTVLEFETQGASSTLPPEVWAAGVRHSLDRGYKFHHWEITNEPWNKGRLKPDEYLAHFLSVSKAIRKADPAAQIGIAIWRAVPYWGNEMLLEKAAGHYDFVTAHYYDFTNPYKNKFEDVVLTSNFMILGHVRKNSELIRKFNPTDGVYQYDTEWGLHGAGARGEPPAGVRRNSNIYGTVYRGVRMIYYAREALLRGASGWEMFIPLEQPFGLLSPQAPERRSMLYWLYYYFNRHIGDWVLAMDGTAPYHEGSVGEKYKNEAIKDFRGPLSPTMVTSNEDGSKLYAIVANGSWDRPVPFRMEVENAFPKRVRAIQLSHENPDADPFLKGKGEFVKVLATELEGAAVKCTIPSHSMVFMEVECAVTQGREG